MNVVLDQTLSVVTITHLELVQRPFRQAARDGSQFRPEREGLYIEQIDANYDKFLRAVKKIGDGWHKRQEHREPFQEHTKAVLEGEKTRMWRLMLKGKEIGFCCAVEGGFPGLADKFNLGVKNQAEVFKIGFYPDYQRKGYGQVLIPAILDELLDTNDGVYLNTRDSNRVNSVPIYEKLGMKIIHQEHVINGTLPKGVAVHLMATDTRTGRTLGTAREFLAARAP